MLDVKTLNFLRNLKANNNREWFHQNKEIYLEAYSDFKTVVINNILPSIMEFDKEINTTCANDCFFRIYRDIRFSKDKSPYKTNFGAYLVKGGKFCNCAGYYFHVEPGSCFLAGGIYMPPNDVLYKIRQEIVYDYKEISKIISENQFIKYFGSISGEKLKKVPKGFDPNFENIELLKFKSYNVSYDISDDIITSKSLIKIATNVYKAMYPFNQFINHSISS